MIEMTDYEKMREEERKKKEEQEAIEIDKRISYDTVILLSAVQNTCCPDWLEDRLNAMISELWDHVGEGVTFSFPKE